MVVCITKSLLRFLLGPKVKDLIVLIKTELTKSKFNTV